MSETVRAAESLKTWLRESEQTLAVAYREVCTMNIFAKGGEYFLAFVLAVLMLPFLLVAGIIGLLEVPRYLKIKRM